MASHWPVILFDRGSSDWTLSHGLFRLAGLVPNAVLEVETIEAANRMVGLGVGLAFLPRLAAAQELRAKNLVFIDGMNAAPLGRSLDLIHSATAPRARRCSAFFARSRPPWARSPGRAVALAPEVAR
ncbi:MAG TPA: LysR family transcriptional regulator substrate-binding protein [Candidatus Methylomirabilis sp.]|nr:LysR family transcriptional regulator substrate-binding protein [Candidatus Methylomirabilis sp.]